MRSVDPVVPMIAADLLVDVKTVALLSTAFTLPYALIQPVLGPVADVLGKTRIMLVALTVVATSALVCAFADSFRLVFAMRIVAGLVAGGVFPVSLALVADLVPMQQRQVALARVLSAAFLGNLLGASGSGLVGDLVGWRGVFAVTATLGFAAAALSYFGFRGLTMAARAPFALSTVATNYRTVLGNPRAKICFSSVFFEGICIQGLFPYVALLLVATGEPRAAIAGLVLAGFGVGGMIYTQIIGHVLPRITQRVLMLAGGALAAIAMTAVAGGVPWPGELIAFMALGMGFYSVHGSIQVHATELAPNARGSALALHSSAFFLGQALGPVAYRFGFEHLGAPTSILIGAVVILLVAMFAARFLPQRLSPV